MIDVLDQLCEAIERYRAAKADIRRLAPLVENSLTPPRLPHQAAGETVAPSQPPTREPRRRKGAGLRPRASTPAEAPTPPPSAPAGKPKVDRRSPEFRAKLAQKIREGIARKKAADGQAQTTPEPKSHPTVELARAAVAGPIRRIPGLGRLCRAEPLKPAPAEPLAAEDDE